VLLRGLLSGMICILSSRGTEVCRRLSGLYEGQDGGIKRFLVLWIQKSSELDCSNGLKSSSYGSVLESRWYTMTDARKRRDKLG
jgi:hypothetical protein